MVRETTALRAWVEPMLMSERQMVTTRETRTAFKGMFHPGVTLMSTPENGRALSRAKAHSCREAVATSLMALAVRVTIKTVHMTFVAL